MSEGRDENQEALRAAARTSERARYVLRLYVAGMTRRSAEAVRRVTEFCERHLEDRYSLEVLDVYQRPTVAASEQIVAVPTLIKHKPEPTRRFIGDMRDDERLLAGMDLRSGGGS